MTIERIGDQAEVINIGDASILSREIYPWLTYYKKQLQMPIEDNDLDGCNYSVESVLRESRNAVKKRHNFFDVPVTYLALLAEKGEVFIGRTFEEASFVTDRHEVVTRVNEIKIPQLRDNKNIGIILLESQIDNDIDQEHQKGIFSGRVVMLDMDRWNKYQELLASSKI